MQRFDSAYLETEKIIEDLEKRITAEYAQAEKEIRAKVKDYFRRFATKKKIKLDAVNAGIITEDNYKKWLAQQELVGERWEALLSEVAADMHSANEIARSIAAGALDDVYALNYNFATYDIEMQSGINTSFTLVNRDTLERLVRDDPKLLPDPGQRVLKKIAEGRDILWNRQQLSSVAFQAIRQGESIPKIAKRLEDKVGKSFTVEDIYKADEKTAEDIAEELSRKNKNAAIRNARTMMTGAQNAGRIDSARRAEDMGINLTNVWTATFDMRTRHEHRILDGQRRKVGEPFEVEGEKIMYPGDPDAPGHLVYNCRCTLITQIKGFEYDITEGQDTSGVDAGMTYDDWKASLVERPNPITLPEQKAEAIKQSYFAEYRKLKKAVENQ